jgi:hypothetical protein
MGIVPGKISELTRRSKPPAKPCFRMDRFSPLGGVRNETIQDALEENDDILDNNKHSTKVNTDNKWNNIGAHLIYIGSLKPAQIFASTISTNNSETHR